MSVFLKGSFARFELCIHTIQIRYKSNKDCKGGSIVVALGCVVAESRDLSMEDEHIVSVGDKIQVRSVVDQCLLQVYLLMEIK